MSRSILALLTLLAGCAKSTGVVFTVTSSGPIANIASLAGMASYGGAAKAFTIAHSPPISLPSADPVTFAVQLPDDASGTLDVTLSALGSDGSTLGSGEGMAAIVAHGVQKNGAIQLTPVAQQGGDFMIAPNGHDFGDQPVTQASAPFSFTVTNTAAQPTLPAISLGSTNAADFTETDDCTAPLAQNATCTIMITFTPSATGMRHAELDVMGNGTTSGVSLDGNGTMPMNAAYTLMPTTFQFDDTAETTTGNSTMFTLTNVGGSASPSLGSSMIAGGTSAAYAVTADGCFGKVLATNDACTITVQFTPPAAGMQSSTLTAAGASAMLNGRGVGTFHAEGNANGGPGAGNFWNSAIALAPDQIFAVDTSNRIWETNGGKPATFTQYTNSVSSNTQTGVVWGPAKNSVYVAGNMGHVGHWAGSGMAFAEFSNVAGALTGMWGTSDADFYVVGGSTADHYTAGSWAAVSMTGSPALNAIWGSAANDLYAVGNGGQIYHGTGGTSWTAVASGLSANTNLYAIAGNSATNIYAVGFDFTVNPVPPIILHFDGVSWAQNQTLPAGMNNAKLNSVWVAPDGEAWISDLLGTILHTDGNGTWTSVGPAGDNTGKYQVAGSSDHDVYVFGEDGNIYHYY